MAVSLEKKQNDKFDFETWINKYKLNDIKQCFIEYEMDTLNSLNMENENYMKLLSDNKIVSNAHLFVNITKGILSINKLRESEQKQLTILPQTENEQFIKIQNYIQQLNKRQNKLKSTIKQQLENKKQENNIFVNQYEKNYKIKLEDIRNKINQIFKNLENECNKNEDALKVILEAETNKIKSIAQNYKKKVRNTESIFSECLSIIIQQKEKNMNSIKKCQDIINKYDEDENNKSKYTEREKDIFNIGHDASDDNKKVNIVLNDKFDEINKFLKYNLNLSTFIYISNMNNPANNRIYHNLNGLIGILNQNDDEKKETYDDAKLKEKNLKKFNGSRQSRRNIDVKRLPKLQQSLAEYTDYVVLRSKSPSKSQYQYQRRISGYSEKSMGAGNVNDTEVEQRKYLFGWPIDEKSQISHGRDQGNPKTIPLQRLKDKKKKNRKKQHSRGKSMELNKNKRSKSILTDNFAMDDNYDIGSLIFCKTITGKTIELSVFLSKYTILDIKDLIFKTEGLPPCRQHLQYHGSKLKDNKKLSHYNIQHESTIHLTLNLKGS